VEEEILKLLKDYKAGVRSETDVLDFLKRLPFEQTGAAIIDHHRALRKAMPEVILCQGKTPAQVAEIAARIVEAGSNLLATRATEDQYLEVKKSVPGAEFDGVSRTIRLGGEESAETGLVLVISAGTSDIPVAEECAVTLRMMGARVEKLYDAGVAGIHRLLSKLDLIRSANVLVVIAGMEGALPSVVAGLVDKPVIAVPTSTGYGTSFGGISALLAMLNSCADGVAVVNIDNGYGAGYISAVINKLAAQSSHADKRLQS
jgi:NCAIR mutase (PurE)-related protein